MYHLVVFQREEREEKNVGNHLMAPISVTVFTGFLGILARTKFVENARLTHLFCRCRKNELDSQVSPQVSSGLQGRFAEKRIWGCPR
jgi:hypothetical protein